MGILPVINICGMGILPVINICGMGILPVINICGMGILPVINIFPSRFCQFPMNPDSRFPIPLFK